MKRLFALRGPLLSSLFLGGVALLFRAYYILHAQPEIPLRADAAQYFRIAINVLQYGTYSSTNPGDGVPIPDSYRGPGYPTMIVLPLALFHDVGASYWFMLSLQVLLGTGVAVLAFLLARRWLSARFAFAAGLLVALSPHLVSQGGYILTEPVFGFLLMAAAVLTARAHETGRPRSFALAGGSFAAAALVNPMIAPFALLPAARLVIARKWTLAALFIAMALVPPGLWMARDVQLHETGEHSSAGRLFENVIVGIEPDYNRFYRDPSDSKGIAARMRVHDGLILFDHDRGEAYRTIFDRVSAQPVEYFVWFLQKPLLLWAWGIGQGAGDLYVYPMRSSPFEANPLYRLIAALFFGLNIPIAAAAFISSALTLRVAFSGRLQEENSFLLLCVAMFLYATAVHTVLIPDARYANPFRPFEYLIALTFLADLMRYLRRFFRRGHAAGPLLANADTSAGTPVSSEP